MESWKVRKRKLRNEAFFFFFWCDGLIIRKNVNLQKEGKEKEKKKKVSRIDDVAVDVVQQECNNNKYYISVFRYI